MTKNNTSSFKKGWNQLSKSQAREVRDKITEALDLKFRTSFYYRLNGSCEPTVTEAKKIEKIFARYGVKNIWGE